MGRYPGGNLAELTSWGGKLASQGGEPPWHGDRAPTGGPGHVRAGAAVGGQVAPLPGGVVLEGTARWHVVWGTLPPIWKES